MSLILNLFLISILMAAATSFPSSTANHQRSGRCRGEAVNYHVSVSHLRDCVEACDKDERCCYYSLHRSVASHPDHNHCLLFRAEECDVTDLMYSGSGHWVTGHRTKAAVTCPHSRVQMPLFRATR